MRRTKLRRWLAGVLIASSAGCSLSVHGPLPSAPASELPRCDRDAGGRIAGDGLFGLVFIALGVAAGSFDACFGEGCENDPGHEFNGAAFALFALPGALLLSSAIVGVRRTNRCQRAHRRHETWRQGQDRRRRATRARAKDACATYIAQWESTPDPSARWLELWPVLPEECTRFIDDKRPDEGMEAGRCFRNHTCHRGLVCLHGMCIPGPGTGDLRGPCYRNATCNGELQCSDGVCSERIIDAEPAP